MDSPIEIKRETEFYQGFIRLKMSVSNKAPSVITDVTLDFIYEDDLLRIDRHEPPYKIKNGKIFLGNINRGTSKSIAIYFDPLMCTRGTEINCSVLYRDENRRLGSAFMETKIISVVCPILNTDSDINVGRLKEFIELLPSRDSRAYEIHESFDIFQLANIAREVVEKYDVRHIRTLHTKDGQKCEMWYYGKTKVQRENIVIKLSLVFEMHSLELFAATEKGEVLTGLLAEVGRNLKSSLETKAAGRGNVINLTIKDSVIQRSSLLDHCDINGNCSADIVVEDSMVQHSIFLPESEEIKPSKEKCESIVPFIDSHDELESLQREIEELRKQKEEEKLKQEIEKLKKLYEEESLLKIKEEEEKLKREIEKLNQLKENERKQKEKEAKERKQREERELKSIEEVEKFKREWEKQKNLRKKKEYMVPNVPVMSNVPMVSNTPMVSDAPKILIENGIEFVLIPAGEFMMGSKDGSNKEQPVHKITIGKSFYMGKYPVTQKQWKAVMGRNPSRFKGNDLPVERVSWNDVQEFLKKLNEMEDTNKYRLPSEAEWEYACCAGTTTRYSFGDDESKLGKYAWSNSGYQSNHVGQKQPNLWGLYDMHGNVWEWCQDSWHSDYNGAPSDGSEWISGSSSDGVIHSGDGRIVYSQVKKDTISSSYRVIRGGSWSSSAGNCRSAARFRFAPGVRDYLIGFRLLRTV